MKSMEFGGSSHKVHTRQQSLIYRSRDVNAVFLDVTANYLLPSGKVYG